MMDTAKVDIRKLQLLNDRINQCLDALNQVRHSVYGLSHSSLPAGGQLAWGSPQIAPFGYQDPRFLPVATAGLSHTPYTPAFTPAMPFGPSFAGFPAAGWLPTPGLSHSGPDFDVARSLAFDPYLAGRIVQTFPFAQLAGPPVTAIP